jgi:hypothetical protein
MSATRRHARTLGFHICVEQQYGVSQVVADVVYLATDADTDNPQEVGKPFNPSFRDLYHTDRHSVAQYDGFRVAAYLHDVSRRPYAVRHEYRHVTGVQLAQVEAMVRVLRKVDRALKSRNQHEGWLAPDDFERYLLRVADAIGAEFFAYRRYDRDGIRITDAAGLRGVLSLFMPMPAVAG